MVFTTGSGGVASIEETKTVYYLYNDRELQKLISPYSINHYGEYIIGPVCLGFWRG